MNSMAHMNHSMHMQSNTVAGTSSNVTGTGPNITGTRSNISDESSGMSGMCSGMAGMDMGGMMAMYFHAGIKEIILFRQLQTETTAEFVGACVAVFLAAFLYELLKVGREELFRSHNVKAEQRAREKSQNERTQLLRSKKQGNSLTSADLRDGMFSWPHLLQTTLHAVQMILSYLLMLVFMTYNAYLCASLIAGATTAYFLTGWRKTWVTDRNEHCH